MERILSSFCFVMQLFIAGFFTSQLGFEYGRLERLTALHLSACHVTIQRLYWGHRLRCYV